MGGLPNGVDLIPNGNNLFNKEHIMKTIEEVASIFKVHFRTIYAWIKHGKVKSVKVGRRHYITDEEVERIKREGF